MIKFNRFNLENGLTVLVHEDHSVATAVFNILYKVGARDESPEQTGLAHLFEHLMFGGSVNIPNYDTHLQVVGGTNNAFTSNDITNYYVTIPSNNLETAFWLESDRMLSLAYNEQSLEIQKQVVIEEFKQRYLNQPYGDVWLKLRPLAYKVHPYQWATIGKELNHIEGVQMADVRKFSKKYYVPNNAILVVAGKVNESEIRTLSEKWFGNIPMGEDVCRNIPAEPIQKEARKLMVEADVPVDSIYIAFHGPDRRSLDYFAMDLLSDVLSKGTSSRLFRALVKDSPVFSEVNAYITGSIDNNLLVVEGKLLKGVSFDRAETEIWTQLNMLKTTLISDKELQKIKNKLESSLIFAMISNLDKAMSLAYYEFLSCAEDYNDERIKYLNVDTIHIKKIAESLFRPQNSNTLYYKSNLKNDVE